MTFISALPGLANHPGQRMIAGSLAPTAGQVCHRPVAVLSLDEGITTSTAFDLPVAALQTIAGKYWSRGVGCAPNPLSHLTESL